MLQSISISNQPPIAWCRNDSFNVANMSHDLVYFSTTHRAGDTTWTATIAWETIGWL